MILGLSCALSETEVHWREFLAGLKERGIGIPDLVASDTHNCLKAALKASLNDTPWQRCQFHLQQNAEEHLEDFVKTTLKSISLPANRNQTETTEPTTIGKSPQPLLQKISAVGRITVATGLTRNSIKSVSKGTKTPDLHNALNSPSYLVTIYPKGARRPQESRRTAPARVEQP